MNIYEKLVSGYPAGDVTPQDFIDHLTIGADGWIGSWISIGLAVIFGLLVYIIPIYLTEKDKLGPYPLWLHTFYCAADFMGIWVFLDAWKNYQHFPLFLLLCIGEEPVREHIAGNGQNDRRRENEREGFHDRKADDDERDRERAALDHLAEVFNIADLDIIFIDKIYAQYDAGEHEYARCDL